MPLQQLVDAKCRQLQGNHQQLFADGLVSWKLNFFRSYAIGHNCPAPVTYAGSVLHNNTNIREPLLSSRTVTLNQGNSTYIFLCRLTIQNHLEQAFPHTFRHRDSPLSLV
ncbi:hypothetical protein P9112_012219 [Eukaryota sp. TZLM1-RC]